MCACWWWWFGTHVVRENQALHAELRATRALLEEARKRADAWCVADHAGSALAERYECKVCMARPIAVAFLPCGHCVCCAACARRQRACPVCCESIDARTPLYLV